MTPEYKFLHMAIIEIVEQLIAILEASERIFIGDED